MDAASLRLKFTSLLKHVTKGDCNSECCIEITPELSSYQNLDKINWAKDSDLVECIIPMTYKVTIKKQGHTNNIFKDKVYHSCVDLLSTNSYSSVNFASGDVPRITSDNVLLRKITSYMDKCDSIIENNATKTSRHDLEKGRAVSIQTLRVPDHKTSLSSQPLPQDKSLEANFKEYRKPVYSTTATIDTDVQKLEDAEYDNVTTFNDKEDSLKIAASFDSLDEHLEHYDAFCAEDTRMKLSLSPICSINTWDELPQGRVNNTNTANYVYIEAEKSSNQNVHTINLTQNVSKKSFNRSSQVVHIFQSKTSMTFNKTHNMSNTEDVCQNLRLKSVNTYRNVSTSMSIIPRKSINLKEVTAASYSKQNTKTLDASHFIDVKNEKFIDISGMLDVRNIFNNINWGCNSKFARCYDKSRNIFPTDSNNDYTLSKTNKSKYNFKPYSFDPIDFKYERVSAQTRVAQILENVEQEIFPLKQKLNEIRNKCMVLGLTLACEKLPHKSDMCVTPPTAASCSKIDHVQNNTKKVNSNRVVYTVLFNG